MNGLGVDGGLCGSLIVNSPFDFRRRWLRQRQSSAGRRQEEIFHSPGPLGEDKRVLGSQSDVRGGGLSL